MTVLALWATPRTVSTAFERMMIERGDHVVLDEPWSRAYYFGPQRRSDRYGLTFPESTYGAVEAGVMSAGAGNAGGAPVFVKDMAYHAVPGITDEALGEMTHTFLIRDPLAALSSLHRRWPNFTEAEAGYDAQRALFDRVVAVTDTVPAVVDSDALVADPDRVVATWCERVGIEHRPEALHWSPGMQPEWQLWRDWYENAAASTGFAAPTAHVGTAPRPTPPDRVLDLVAVAERAVAPLRAHAIA